MPDLGRLRRDRLPHALPVTSPMYPPPPWPLPGARTLKLVYETDSQTALDWLPPSLARTSPAYAIVTVTQYPESPVGPFSLAAQHLGCRARMFVRAFTLGAVTDSERALAALREVWGYPALLGKVRLTASKSGARGSVSISGRAMVEARLTNSEPCDPALIRFDPLLNLRLIGGVHEGRRHSLVEMVQIDPDHTVSEAQRGRAQLAFPLDDRGGGWSLLPPLNVIAASYSVGDTELPLARFVVPY